MKYVFKVPISVWYMCVDIRFITFTSRLLNLLSETTVKHHMYAGISDLKRLVKS